MNKQISKRHHYIPEFFIKGFVDETGTLAVFYKHKNRTWSKRAVPKQIFFENNRNLFNIKGKETDFLEKLYGNSENKFAPILNKIITQENSIMITLDEKLQLILFLAQTYWRIPETDEEIEHLIKETSPEELNIAFKDKETGEYAPKDFYDIILSERSFIQSYRFAKPLLDFIKKDTEADWLKNWVVYYSPRNSKMQILGDNPIIIKDDTVENIYTNELIFPFSSQQTLYHTKGNKIPQIPAEIKMKIDILLFLQAEKWVCGQREDYLKTVAYLASTYNDANKIKRLKSEIFEIFTN